MNANQPGAQGALDQDGCVLTCTVSDCDFNRDLECFAQRIQVGDDHPMCDTFTRAHGEHHPRQAEGVVATCGVTMCNFNDNKECHARGITVDFHSEHADCVTFRP